MAFSWGRRKKPAHMCLVIRGRTQISNSELSSILPSLGSLHMFLGTSHFSSLLDQILTSRLLARESCNGVRKAVPGVCDMDGHGGVGR